MAANQFSTDPVMMAKQAIEALGRGYDVTKDLCLKSCKSDPLIELVESQTQNLVIPGDLVIPGVPASFKCDKGDRSTFRSGILSFNEMSEKFNQSLSIMGKIPLGLFNSAFNFTGAWLKDASTTRSLAMDGVFITLYSLELPRTQLILKDEVKQALPSSWDPVALANFVGKYGTHVIVGVEIGGKDVIYLKQQLSSPLSSSEVQECLEMKAKERFLSCEGSALKDVVNEGKGLTVMWKRKGGLQVELSHNEWLKTVPLYPDVISMSFIPITILLSDVVGSGFLSHAINLYLRYKPPTTDLIPFLAFQVPREWAPAFSDLPLVHPREISVKPSLQFRLMGPKLQINTIPVIVGKRPVTGLRLCLCGSKSNRLEVQVQYIVSIVETLRDWAGGEEEWKLPEFGYREYCQPVLWKSFSHVYTAPVEHNEEHGGVFVVIGAQLQVEKQGTRKVLFLKLLYSRIPKTKVQRNEWDDIDKRVELQVFSYSERSTRETRPIVIDSAAYPGGPKVLGQVPKLLKFVDTKEVVRGPSDGPGHWLVTGAKLSLNNGKISVSVKYSLLLYNAE